jgi:hypothetical protein
MRFDIEGGNCDSMNSRESGALLQHNAVEPVRCSARFNQFFEIVQIPVDSTRDGATEAGAQL